MGALGDIDCDDFDCSPSEPGMVDPKVPMSDGCRRCHYALEDFINVEQRECIQQRRRRRCTNTNRGIYNLNRDLYGELTAEAQVIEDAGLPSTPPPPKTKTRRRRGGRGGGRRSARGGGRRCPRRGGRRCAMPAEGDGAGRGVGCIAGPSRQDELSGLVPRSRRRTGRREPLPLAPRRQHAASHHVAAQVHIASRARPSGRSRPPSRRALSCCIYNASGQSRATYRPHQRRRVGGRRGALEVGDARQADGNPLPAQKLPPGDLYDGSINSRACRTRASTTTSATTCSEGGETGKPYIVSLSGLTLAKPGDAHASRRRRAHPGSSRRSSSTSRARTFPASRRSRSTLSRWRTSSRRCARTSRSRRAACRSA